MARERKPRAKRAGAGGVPLPASDMPLRRARGRPPGDRSTKVAELLRAARAVIAREGCGAASLRKVAEAAGVTTGAIAYYFADRDALLAGVVQDLFDDFDRWLDPDDGLAGIRAMSEYQLLRRRAPTERQAAQAVWLQLLVHASTNPGLAVVIERHYARFRERLTVLIARAQAGGRIRRDHPPDLLADFVSALGDGLLVLHSAQRTHFDRARMQRMVDMLVALLLPASEVDDQPAGS